MWTSSKDALPPLGKGDEYSGCDRTSVRVLGVVYGQHRVVVLEQWDEDSPPAWYSACSEHWNLDDDVTHWQYMEDLPEGV